MDDNRRKSYRKTRIRPIDQVLGCGEAKLEDLAHYEGWLAPNAKGLAFAERCGGVVGLSAERESLAWAVCDSGGIVHQGRIEAPIAPVEGDPLDPDAFAELLSEALTQAAPHLPSQRLAAIGMAWPGAIDRDGEPVEYAVHHQDFQEDPLTGEPRRLRPLVRDAVARTGLTWTTAGADPDGPFVTIVNDADADLLYEIRHGVARGKRNVMCVKLCGGLGMSLLHEGELVHGHAGRAGEIQHIRVRYEEFEFDKRHSRPATRNLAGRHRCTCGGTNCVACFATGKAIIEQLPAFGKRRQSYTERGRAIERSHEHGDVTAVFERAGRLLGQALIGPVLAFDPEYLVVSAFPSNNALLLGLRQALTVGTGAALKADNIDFASGRDGETAAGAARLVTEHSVVPWLERELRLESAVTRADLPALLRRHVDGHDGVGALVRPYRRPSDAP